MTFLIVTNVLHKKSGDSVCAYGPYVREMNIWLKNFDKILITAPIDLKSEPNGNDLFYEHPDIIFIPIPQISMSGFRETLRTIYYLPLITFKIIKGMKVADHIHIRCPGNMGLLGTVIQIFFPGKAKTAKYAGNWDWSSKQPWSYRLQQIMLRSTLLTHNMKVLVYGDWPDKTRNILPFFTATYSLKDRLPVNKPDLTEGVNLAFIGGLYKYKNPATSLEVLKTLVGRGINARLTFCGDGPEKEMLEQTGKLYGLEERLKFTGNVNSERVKEVLCESHFLVFISRSEGWPKAVAEAMWWGCLPITTRVSCVPQMLGYGERGDLVDNNIQKITEIIKHYIQNPAEYLLKSSQAMEWSREYTVEKFESGIKQIIGE